MKRSEQFMLYEIAGVPYLLPLGQKIADHQRGIQINSTGVYLWSILETELTQQEVIQLCAAHFQASEEELPLLEKDIKQFLHTLKAHGILEETASAPMPCATMQQYLTIGGLTLTLAGPTEACFPAFDAFRVQAPTTIHQTITVVMHPPRQRQIGEVLLRSEDLIVLDIGERYLLLFPSCGQIYEAQLTKDGSQVTFYCQPPYTEEFREYLFHAIRLPFLYLAQRYGMVVIHSASLLYRDRAWLFAGHSGAGKSTHTKLWQEVLQAPLLNGDLNLLEYKDGRTKVHGLPWCGTSGISTTESHPLGGIVLLKKADHNYVEALSPNQKQLLVAQRFISPAWTAELLQKNLKLTESIVEGILVCRLHCTKNRSVVDTMKQAIDDFLS